MATALQHLAEAQAIAQEEARHDAEPAPLWEQIAWARHNIAKLGDVPGLVDLAELATGVCGECGGEASTRFRFGAFELCRTCATRRLAARRHDLPRRIVSPVQLENLEPPEDITRWAKEAGRHITDRAIVAHLDQWDIHGADRDKLLKIAQHVRDGVAAKEAV